MGSFLDKPKTDTDPEIKTGNGLTAALVSMQGWRITQEDAHVMQMGVPGHDTTSWFGVFDGHGGSLIANEAAKRLLGHVDLASLEPEKLKVALRAGFLACDAEMRQMDAVQRGDDHSGCTAVTVMVTPDHIICANAGDSRAILITGGKAKALSDDHKPNNEAETARIVKAGGTVHMRRVNGDLAVSRALGDYVYKTSHQLPPEAQQVSPEPDFVVHDRDAAADQFVLLACDGIWDVMSNEEAAEFVLARIEAGVADLGELADEMIRHCLHLGSRDNMSVVLVGLPGAPAPTAEAQAAHAAAKAAKEAAAATAAAGAEGSATDADGDVSVE